MLHLHQVELVGVAFLAALSHVRERRLARALELNGFSLGGKAIEGCPEDRVGVVLDAHGKHDFAVLQLKEPPRIVLMLPAVTH